jgi:uncharacterized protein with HEPN domain
MQPELRERLRHVLDAGEKILHVTSGKTFEEYDRHELLPDATERQFMIIGEALREAARVEPAIRTRITSFRRIVDFRNVIVHDYATVYNEGVWRIIEEHLPILLTEVRAVLATPDDDA